METKKYKKPTVKTVIFQIRFSNLFMIENIIGEFQANILEKFPESHFTVRRELLFADVGPEFQMEEIIPKETVGGRKIWSFKSMDDKYVLNVLTNSIDITSKKHKSYSGTQENEGFRDIIEFVIESFKKLVPIKVIKRIGLRYTDETPVPPELGKETFENWYNTALPLKRFKLDNVGSMFVEVLNIKRDGYEFNYRERISYEAIKGSEEKQLKYFLDFDAYAGNITTDEILNVTDKLHDIIHDEWENNTIKQPVKDWMDEEREE